MTTKMAMLILLASSLALPLGASAEPIGGLSGLPCPGRLTRCDRTCHDLQTDAANCGRCALTCGAGRHCASGRCVADAAARPGCTRSGAGLTWNCAGPIAGQSCIQILEAADPDTWSDNHLCASGSMALRWSSAGPINGMRCTRIFEDAEPADHTWNDNYLCAPLSSKVLYSWSQAGPIAGRSCVQWLEPADPHAWSDNYLCAQPAPSTPPGRCPTGQIRCSCNGVCAPPAACHHICH